MSVPYLLFKIREYKGELELKIIFKDLILFRVVLGSQQNQEGAVQRFPMYPCSSQSHINAPLIHPPPPVIVVQLFKLMDVRWHIIVAHLT